MKCENCKEHIVADQPRIIRGGSYIHQMIRDCSVKTVSGSKLKAFRTKNRLSINKLAKLISRSSAYIQKVEKGFLTEDRFKEIQKLSKAGKSWKDSLRPEVVKQGSKLKADRIAAGIRRVDMVKMMGMNYSAYENYERGKSKMSKEFKKKAYAIIKGETKIVEPPVEFSPVVCISKEELERLQESHNNFLAIKKLLAL